MWSQLCSVVVKKLLHPPAGESGEKVVKSHHNPDHLFGRVVSKKGASFVHQKNITFPVSHVFLRISLVQMLFALYTTSEGFSCLPSRDTAVLGTRVKFFVPRA